MLRDGWAGERCCGGMCDRELDLAAAIRLGLPARAIDYVLKSQEIDPGELYRLVAPRRTVQRKRAAQQRLSPEESDRLTRVIRVIDRAEDTLGDRGKAHHWLRTTNRALAGERPIDLLDSDGGVRMVERLLGRIEYGVFA